MAEMFHTVPDDFHDALAWHKTMKTHSFWHQLLAIKAHKLKKLEEAAAFICI